MTGARFQQIQQGSPPTSEEEKVEYQRLLAWRARSDAAKRAVATKRRKYRVWPSRSKAYKEG